MGGRFMTFQLALRNIRRQRGRSLFVVAAVALGVSALVLAGGFIKDTVVELGDSIIYSHTGHLQLSKAGYREEASFDPESFLMADTQSLREDLGARPAVKQVLLRLYSAGLAGNGDSDWPVAVEGIEASREAELGSYINLAQGRRLEDSDSFGVLLGAGVAQALDLKPGDWLDLVANTLDGAMNSLEFEVIGVFQTFSKEYDTYAVRIPLAAAQELIGASGANVAVIELAETESTEPVARSLDGLVKQRGLELRRWDQLDPFYRQTVALYRQQFGFLIAVILSLVVLGVGTAIGMGIYERAAEFGTLRALGTSDADVARLITLETALLGFVGALVGVVLGNALALVISEVGIPMPPPPNSDLGYVSLIRFSLPVSLLAFAVGVAAPVLAALRPTWRSCRQPIIDGLRQAV